jgi:DNA helicase-2/ATP-dependent DNA helicase PcrA
VIVPQRFFAHGQRNNGDRHMYASRTRFIPSALLDRFECCAWPRVATAQTSTRPPHAPVNIGERVRRTWRQQ